MGVTMETVLSHDRTLRYQLHRRVSLLSERVALFVMLNPSTADEAADDPTIRRCRGFAASLDCGHLLVANLFPYRATDPKDLRRWLGGEPFKTARPLAYHENRQAIHDAAAAADVIVAAWGNHGAIGGAGRETLKLLDAWGHEVWHFGLTRAGQPRHPLYVPKAATLRQFQWVDVRVVVEKRGES